MSFDQTVDRRLNPDTERFGLKAFHPSRAMRVCVPVANCHPNANAKIIDTQFNLGTLVDVIADAGNCRLYVQSKVDGYCGFVDAQNLDDLTAPPTHHVHVPRTFVYAEPDMKSPMRLALSVSAKLIVIDQAETRGTLYSKTPEGWLVSDHISHTTTTLCDAVTFAEMLEHTPYLWGGASALGIDCSGLVQLCFSMAGQPVLRDTDMQSDTLGVPIDEENLRRGDCVFWKGHVALMTDQTTIVHANGHSMDVRIEPFKAACARIEPLYGAPIRYRRPQ